MSKTAEVTTGLFYGGIWVLAPDRPVLVDVFSEDWRKGSNRGTAPLSRARIHDEIAFVGRAPLLVAQASNQIVADRMGLKARQG